MQTLTLPEQFLLLSLNRKGDIRNSRTGYRAYIEAYMIGVVLVSLMLDNKIQIKDKEIHILNDKPTGISYYDYVINKISVSNVPVKLQKFISSSISWGSKKVFKLIMESLFEKQVVKSVEGTFLLIFHKTSYLPDLELADKIIQKIRAEILEEGKIDKVVAALSLLLNQSKLLKFYFSDYERDDLNKKIKNLKNDKNSELQEINTTVKTIQYIIDAINATMVVIAASSGSH